MKHYLISRFSLIFLFLLCSVPLLAQLQLDSLSIIGNNSFRGIAAISDSVCWISGSNGAVFRIEEAGKKIISCSPAGYDSSDFRDIHAFDENKAFVLSAGLPAVILKTINGGESWKEVYRNEEKGVFFDAFDFWNEERGIAFSDARGPYLLLIETQDGGNSWSPIEQFRIPMVHTDQGGFAASGTCLKTFAGGKVIIGLGGPEASVLSSYDYGQHWSKGAAPIDNGEPSKGIFSFDFLDEKRILAVGGDYRGDSLSTDCISISLNGGHSWKTRQEAGFGLRKKYRSAVVVINERQWLALSRTGTSYTDDAGKNWKEFPFYFYSASKAEKSIWVSGSDGKVGRIRWTE